MKNLLKWQLLVIVGCVVFGCNEDPLTGSLSDDLIIEGRSSECDRSISFSKKSPAMYHLMFPIQNLLWAKNY